MKYAMLIYSKPGSHEELSPDEQRSVFGEYMAINDDPGVYGGDRLAPVETATSVRVNDGQVLTTDGPFADTKEILGGFYLFEADDLDRAIALASRIPAARLGGCVEVRPIAEM
jgi:hypothetical protein